MSGRPAVAEDLPEGCLPADQVGDDGTPV
ncbi:MAG: hypothetical protein RLZZ127_2462, partial [Planctomycetota bacterium]